MKLKYEIEIMELDGKPVAVPVYTNEEFHGILHMNETTADILKILENDVTMDIIVSKLLEQYDATEEQAKENVEKVLAILRENNLLIE